MLGFVCALSLSIPVSGETVAILETAETRIRVQPGSTAPLLLSLQNGTTVWKNDAAEALISSVQLDGKTVSIAWAYNNATSQVDRRVVRFVYDTVAPHLRLTWEWEVRSMHGPIEHEIRIENLDSREVWLPLQPSLVCNWQTTLRDKLEQFYIEKGADTPSSVGTHVVTISDPYEWVGMSSTYAQPRPGAPREIIPYFMVTKVGGTQPGWYVGIEFSGRTRLTLKRTATSLRAELGLNPEPAPFRTRLKPGEVFETPRIFLGATHGGPDATGNALRRWVREVLGNAETWKDPRYPFVVNNSWGGGTRINDELARHMIRDAASLGFEMFHMDAGWFRGVGDWYPDAGKFPDGLKSIADEAHALGLKFGLWVDWAQAGVDTAPGALNIEDPVTREWLTTDPPANWRPEAFKGTTIDIGVPEAEAWAKRETDRIVTDYKIDMLEHDGYLVAKGCDRADHPHAPPDPLNRCSYQDSGFQFACSSNSTDVSYHAVRSYYEIQSALRRQHPGLLLELCNDGGRMIDFGSAAHGDYFSITDTYDPLSNRRAFYDASFVLSSAMLEAYVERWPTPKIDNFRYMLRSGMMGWLSVMIDTTSWDPEQHAEAKKELRLYKSQLRPLIRDGDLYHLSRRPDGVHWDGIEYFDPTSHRGVVYAFRGSNRSELKHTFVLYGLHRSARYHLHYHDHSGADRTVSGAELMQAGVPVRLPFPNSSEIIFLEAVPRPSGKN